MNPTSPRELRRVTIKEEFVALTGDHVKAAILDRLDQLQKKVEDFDRFIREEKERSAAGGGEVEILETGGWIYKDATDLAEETMLSASKSTMGRRLGELVESGYVIRRRNPAHRWDKTYQYRLDLHKIRADLADLGYALEGWYLPANDAEEAPKHRSFKMKHRDANLQHRGFTAQHRDDVSETSAIQSETSKPQIDTAIPVGSIDDGDLPSVDHSPRVPPDDGDQAPISSTDQPRAFAEATFRDIRLMSEEVVTEQAEQTAGQILARFDETGYELNGSETARLAQLCIDAGKEDVLLRVAGRVARKANVEHPFRYLVKSVGDEPEDTGLAARVRARASNGKVESAQSGAQRRRQGYEWLFAEQSQTKTGELQPHNTNTWSTEGGRP